MSEVTSGPFGLYMGMKLNQLDAQPLENALGKYILKSVPKPHSSFGTYVVQVGNNSGLSWIKAIGKDIATSVYGIELITAFNQMRTKLDNTYAKGELTDVLLPESIWDEPKDWMASLIRKERILMCIWDASKGARLKNNLTSIALGANANDTDSGFLFLEYEFSNNDQCDKEIAAEEDSVL